MALRVPPEQLMAHAPLLKRWQDQGGSAAEPAGEILGRAQGRDAAALHDRVDAVEAKVAEMNGQITETCHDMDAVVAYVDAHVAEVKEFIATVAMKLPQPERFSVQEFAWKKKGKKVLSLHFACCRGSGKEMTTETLEWGKWCKIGFSLAAVGKAVIDVTSNPMGLVLEGAKAIKCVHDAFKNDDAADFNTYIKEPFLSAAERDKLIGQLRDAKFFDAFAYDAQLGGWYSLEAFPTEVGVPVAAGGGGASSGASAAAGAGGSVAAGAVAAPPKPAASLFSASSRNKAAAATAASREAVVVVPWRAAHGTEGFDGGQWGGDGAAAMKAVALPKTPAAAQKQPAAFAAAVGKAIAVLADSAAQGAHEQVRRTTALCALCTLCTLCSTH